MSASTEVRRIADRLSGGWDDRCLEDHPKVKSRSGHGITWDGFRVTAHDGTVYDVTIEVVAVPPAGSKI